MLILLPTVVPSSFGHTVLTIDKSGRSYSAFISPVADCHGGSACTLASVDGEQSSLLDKSGRHAARLKDGTIAWFESHRCGANCNGSATLVFKRGDAIYTIAVKAGTLPMTMVIANGLRPAR